MNAETPPLQENESSLAHTPHSLEVFDLGLTPYNETWELQKDRQAKLIRKEVLPALFFCEHAPVITLGTSGKREHVLLSDEQLRERDISVVQIERGGDVTYHGPGQIVMYPIIDLRQKRTDVGWYMRSLEEVVLRTLADLQIQGTRIAQRTGVWVERSVKSESPRKIASLGVRISRWCTMHGIALNVTPQTVGFNAIYPCGYRDVSVTSVHEEVPRVVSLGDVKGLLLHHFVETFEYERPTQLQKERQ